MIIKNIKMKSNIKKIIAVLVVVGTFGAYVISQKMSSDDNYVASNSTSAGSETLNPGVNSTSTVPAPIAEVPKPLTKPVTKPVTKPIVIPTPTPAPAPKPVGAFKDGSYTGSAADAYFGTVQVKAVIQNGKLADVVFLQYPNDNNTSLRKSNMSMPQLTSEAISVQSANVNAISGATETSRAFVETLQNALTQAKNV